MESDLLWNEAKRQANIVKHGLDFLRAGEVLGSRYRLDVPVVCGGEYRVQSFSYVMEQPCCACRRAYRPQWRGAHYQFQDSKRG